MTEEQARHIISNNENPSFNRNGDFELYLNADYQGAKCYLEAIEKAKVLVDALYKSDSLLEQWRNQGRNQKQILDQRNANHEALAKWEKQ